MLVFARSAFGKLRVDSSAPPAQLPSLRLFLASIAYRGWNFRVTDVSISFLGENTLGRDIFVVPA